MEKSLDKIIEYSKEYYNNLELNEDDNKAYSKFDLQVTILFISAKSISTKYTINKDIETIIKKIFDKFLKKNDDYNIYKTGMALVRIGAHLPNNIFKRLNGDEVSAGPSDYL